MAEPNRSWLSVYGPGQYGRGILRAQDYNTKSTTIQDEEADATQGRLVDRPTLTTRSIVSKVLSFNITILFTSYNI